LRNLALKLRLKRVALPLEVLRLRLPPICRFD
jgi:hypothetical protein